jgi:hypothetical protein
VFHLTGRIPMGAVNTTTLAWRLSIAEPVNTRMASWLIKPGVVLVSSLHLLSPSS